MHIACLVIYLLVAISLIFLIMLQHGKGIDIGGNSFNIRNLLEGVGSNFSGNLITRLTAVLGVLFFFLSLLLGNISNKCSRKLYVDNDSRLKEQSYSNSITSATTQGGFVNNVTK